MSRYNKDLIKFVPEPTVDNPLVVDDYPYGFRLRTKIRYWIETKKGKGQRSVSQTLNPKTGRWNTPKPSTYSDIMVVYIDKTNGYVQHAVLSFSDGEAELKEFIDAFESVLTSYQRARIRVFKAIIETRKHVKVTIRSEGYYTYGESKEKFEQWKKEEEEHKKQQEETKQSLRGILALNLRKQEELDGIRPMTKEQKDLLEQINSNAPKK